MGDASVVVQEDLPTTPKVCQQPLENQVYLVRGE